VPVEPDDTRESFEARMHAAEHRIIVEAIRVAAAAQVEESTVEPAI
jgi:folate-dependent phosphoribosylglycinamide formyltransferase PurN